MPKKVLLEPKTSFGMYLRQLRLARGWTLQELSDRSGITSSYLNKMETGRMNPPRTMIIDRVADTLDVERAVLVRYSGRVPLSVCQQLLMGNTLLAELLELLGRQPLPEEVYQEMIALVKATHKSE